MGRGHSDLESDDADILLQGRSTGVQITRRQKIGLAAFSGTVLLVGLAALLNFGKAPANAGVNAVEQKVLTEIEPRSSGCSMTGKDCSSTKCCKISGETCWGGSGTAMCSKQCKSSTCIPLKPDYVTQPVVYVPGSTLHCYTFAMTKVGPSLDTTKQVDLVKKQWSLKTSIFACDSYEVFSDEAFCLEDGDCATEISVDLASEGLTRKDKPEKFLNTPAFYAVWTEMKKSGKYLTKDWTVKVDPQTVFLPARLRAFLHGQPETEGGNYYENCEGVLSGFFGNIEVTNMKATSVFLDHLDTCYSTLCWKKPLECEKEWKFGPWGEDKFMQECMDANGVQMIQGFELTTSGTCPHTRPAGKKHDTDYVPPCEGATTPAIHPFRSVDSYVECLAKVAA